MTLYRLRTTYLGASGPSEYYYKNKADAEKELWDLDNGEIEKVEVTSDFPLNYCRDGCTMCDLTFGAFDAEVEVLG